MGETGGEAGALEGPTVGLCWPWEQPWDDAEVGILLL